MNSPNQSSEDKSSSDILKQQGDGGKAMKESAEASRRESTIPEGEDSSFGQLRNVWREFLGQTSLHGCRNVRETRLLTREHPYITNWQSQRKASILAPGVTLCFPAKYHRQKVRYSSEAHKAFVYMDTGISFLDKESHPRSVEDLIHDLENVTLSKVRQDIGFTTREVFKSAEIVINGSARDILNAMVQVETQTSSCWVVEAFSPNMGIKQDIAARNHYSALDNKAAHETNSKLFSNFNVTSGERHNNSRFRDNLHRLENISSISPKQLLSLSSPDSNISSDIKINDDETEQEKSMTEDDRQANHIELLYLGPRDYISFSLNLQQENWLATDPRAGLEVYLHQPGTSFWSVKPLHLRPGTFNTIDFSNTLYKFLPLPYESFKSSLDLGSGPGTFNTIDFSNTLYKFLPLPYESFKSSLDLGSGCVDIEDSSFQSPISRFPQSLYTDEMCVLETVTNATISKCSCSTNSPFASFYDIPECSILNFQTCYKPVFNYEFFVRGTDKAAICPPPCSKMRFDAAVSATDYPSLSQKRDVAERMGIPDDLVRENAMVVVLQSRSQVSLRMEHVPEISLLDILGSVGGWMGLCLGASLLTLTEFLQAMTTSLWILCRMFLRLLRSLVRPRFKTPARLNA
ncbi:acid-sensing ion channel 1 [Plakobranchus ocellatus]|uniref:Acid-sensing ion channel 1 n=1 Tax=Plakobranchus ocellatus TaxID=259542 RepID=A0AAV3Z4W5_9GAST|nr:acid-sensing ion channel 1 [Plakobranchus ocellatus]